MAGLKQLIGTQARFSRDLQRSEVGVLRPLGHIVVVCALLHAPLTVRKDPSREYNCLMLF